ncbi:NAD(P)-dependent oxidoreductase [Paralimibaculum aggregatum]|uniref:NAD(P)-dependent oxidoreductase n=1 Tax=Paralimibaculum aggregatum TaxID=3036245 RepID=A0ABQ6LN55_9RHOB|nr:NAD(P)-dependent oxidoreductase [Limibaculum sp. NKW23]GMG84630.1 NAD(P)-dependent oxidoreductase [Limibaculum sp. NKW23]
MNGKPVVGFIGVGLMGWGMAKNAVEKGFPLRVVAHRKRKAVEDLVARGAEERAGAAELAAECDIIVLCVTGSPQVEANIAEIRGRARPGLTIIDSTTADPGSTEALAASLAEDDITLIDAPLSRTPAHAWDGELTTYVGGPAAEIERIRPLLETWASAIIPTGGPVGSAHALKLVNNLIGIGYAAIWSEAYAMVERLGVPPAVLHEVVTNSGMTCGNFQNYSKYVLEGDNSAHKFALANCLKDLGYYSRLAAEHNAPTLVSDGVLQLLKIGVNLGHGERYMPEMVEIVRALHPQD